MSARARGEQTPRGMDSYSQALVDVTVARDEATIASRMANANTTKVFAKRGPIDAHEFKTENGDLLVVSNKHLQDGGRVPNPPLVLPTLAATPISDPTDPEEEQIKDVMRKHKFVGVSYHEVRGDKLTSAIQAMLVSGTYNHIANSHLPMGTRVKAQLIPSSQSRRDASGLARPPPRFGEHNSANGYKLALVPEESTKTLAERLSEHIHKAAARPVGDGAGAHPHDQSGVHDAMEVFTRALMDIVKFTLISGQREIDNAVFEALSRQGEAALRKMFAGVGKTMRESDLVFDPNSKFTGINGHPVNGVDFQLNLGINLIQALFDVVRAEHQWDAGIMLRGGVRGEITEVML